MKGHGLISLVLFALFSSEVVAEGEWSPKVEFYLESGGYKETLLWISGYGYALTETAVANRKAGISGAYCLPSEGHIGSKPLLAILNEKFKGETITSEQASRALMEELAKVFRCE